MSRSTSPDGAAVKYEYSLNEDTLAATIHRAQGAEEITIWLRKGPEEGWNKLYTSEGSQEDVVAFLHRFFGSDAVKIHGAIDWYIKSNASIGPGIRDTSLQILLYGLLKAVQRDV